MSNQHHTYLMPSLSCGCVSGSNASPTFSIIFFSILTLSSPGANKSKICSGLTLLPARGDAARCEIRATWVSLPLNSPLCDCRAQARVQHSTQSATSHERSAHLPMLTASAGSWRLYFQPLRHSVTLPSERLLHSLLFF
jgi:hypothetical protein